MTRDLLFELGCEDLPPLQIVQALENLSSGFREHAEALRIEHGEIKVYATPRRMTLLIENVVEKQSDLEETKVGPPARAAFDADGNPTRAALGFMKGLGIESADALIRVTQEKKKGKPAEYIAAVVKEDGKPVQNLLPELLTALPNQIHWPKSMRWGACPQAFARPVHWILARFGDHTVPCAFAGIESGTTTRGHRFHDPDDVEVHKAADYLETLRARRVIADLEERRARILEVARESAASVSGQLLEDDDLLNEIVHLVEWPVAIVGTFEEDYLELPHEVLVTSMKKHQRYFSVVDADGAPMPHFVTIANTEVRDRAVVAKGNLRVLRARLEDARFFYRTDQKKTLDEHNEGLRRVTYVEGLGSVYDKVLRVRQVAVWLAEQLRPGDAQFSSDVERAASLCKADLVTGMVGEFADLQGIMGSYYARSLGESEAVGSAIAEHYAPRGASDALPASAVGAVVSIADKMDSMAALFSLGRIPTGAADPFALRRAAIGVIRIAVEDDLRFHLGQLIATAFDAVVETAARLGTELQDMDTRRAKLLDFVHTRLRGLAQEHHAKQVVDAVLALGASLEDVPATMARIQALDAVRPTEDFEPIAAAFKRVGGILGAELPTGSTQPELFDHEAETALFDALSGARGAFDQQLAERQFHPAMATLMTLRPTIDSFFDNVMVNVDDERVRANRHCLLRDVLQLYLGFADVRRLQG